MGGCCCCQRVRVSPKYQYTNLAITANNPSNLIDAYEKTNAVTLEKTLAPFQGKIKNLSTKIRKAKQRFGAESAHGLSRDEAAAIHIWSDETEAGSISEHLRDALESANGDEIKIWCPYLRLLYAGVKKCPDAETDVWQGIPYNESWDNKLRSSSILLYTYFGSAALSEVDVCERLKTKGGSEKMIIVKYDQSLAKNVSNYSADQADKTILKPGLVLLQRSPFEVLLDGTVKFQVKRGTSIDSVQVNRSSHDFGLCFQEV